MMNKSFDKPCLVTGAGGFLARRVVRRLLDAGATVRGLVRSPSSAKKLLEEIGSEHQERLDLVTGDFVRKADCRRAVEGCGVVWHIAAQLSGSVSPLVFTNVIGTKQLIAAAAEACTDRLVVVSSIAVCDTQKLRQRDVVDESLPVESQPQLRDPYTYSKVQQELAAREECKRLGLPLVIVRPGVIYGPGRGCMSARVGLTVAGITLVIGGRHPLPYVHVDNCADAVTLAGSASGVAGKTFNLVDDVLPTGRQIVRAHRQNGKKLRTVTMPVFLVKRLSSLVERYHHWSQGQLPAVLTPYKVDAMWKPLRYSNALAKSSLGWRPQVSLEDGIAESFV
jgi:nucleoside-diphosphate-sugar epimerase